MEDQEKEFMETKADIDSIVKSAQEVLEPKLAPINRIIADIKEQLVHGTDRIPTAQFHEWGLALSVATSELTPHKDAYALASALWKQDINKSNAKTVAERRGNSKKVDIENDNVLVNADKETQKIILDYMAQIIKDTQDNVYQMCSELNRIMDSRTRFGEQK
ncbi:MAG: hypothetical protein NC218_01475 [Acetobacter sp.]|nr:hypothetical protein [Acetobacter sp.]